MRSFDKRRGSKLFPLILAAALAGCVGSGGKPAGLAAATAANGPAADYPVVIGEPYVVDGVTYEPRDVLNYDEVGYIAIDPQGGDTISGEHHTLPLPSYVEVTSLETGRTILVRLERRGPMAGNSLIGLSQAAANQLGAVAGTPVRVRRVNPPEHERALLRAGEQAPPRMDTPISLVNVLRRKLPNGEGPLPVELAAATGAPETAPTGAEDSALALPPLEAEPAPPPEPSPAPAPSPQPGPDGPAHGYVVQAGAFSKQENADRVAAAIGGEISKSGSLYRVRTGPFETREEAEASLAKVRAAGYSDARIFDGG